MELEREGNDTMPICLSRTLRRQELPVINICFALLGLYVSLIISSLARHFETQDPPNGRRGCALFSAVLEYFSVAYLLWTVAEAMLLLWAYIKTQDMRVPGKVLVTTMLVCWCKWK